MEAQQETVTTPEAMMKKIEGLKKDGKKSILLLVANPQGETRFVAVPID